MSFQQFARAFVALLAFLIALAAISGCLRRDPKTYAVPVPTPMPATELPNTPPPIPAPPPVETSASPVFETVELVPLKVPAPPRSAANLRLPKAAPKPQQKPKLKPKPQPVADHPATPVWALEFLKGEAHGR